MNAFALRSRCRLFLAASAVGLALLAAGCPSVPEECRTDADCAADAVCRDFLCVPRTGSGVDSGPDPIVDAGEPPADVAVIEEDAGPTEEDAGPTEEDAGPDEVDSGPSAPDAGPSDDDAGASDDDAGDAG